MEGTLPGYENNSDRMDGAVNNNYNDINNTDSYNDIGGGDDFGGFDV